MMDEEAVEEVEKEEQGVEIGREGGSISPVPGKCCIMTAA